MKKIFYPYSTYLGCAILNHNPYVYSVKFSRTALQLVYFEEFYWLVLGRKNHQLTFKYAT